MALKTQYVEHHHCITTISIILSVFLSSSDGFNRVSGQSGSCVGVAGKILKLYTFVHQLE